MDEGWLTALLDAIFKGGFDNYARAAHECLGLPVAITDAKAHNLAFYPDEPFSDPLWTCLTGERKVPFSMIQRFNDDGILHRSAKEKTAYFFPAEQSKGYPHIFGNVFVRGAIAGYIDVLCCSVNDATEERLKFVDLMCKAVAIELERLGNPKRLRDAFEMVFSRLMEGQELDENEISQFLAFSEKNFKPRFAIVAIQPKELGATEEKTTILPFVYSYVDQILEDSKTAIYDHCIYVLVYNIQDMG
jgi:hypothetical protein